MSQENVEIVRAVIDALNNGDLDAAVKDAAPDFEFDFSRAVGPTQGVFGRDDMAGVFGEFLEPWESVRWTVGEVLVAGEQVVTLVLGVHRGRGGIEVQARAALVWTFRNSEVTRCCFYQEQQEALEAAGLRE